MTLIFGLLAATVGGVVYDAMQKFQKQMQENADAAKASAKDIGNANQQQASDITQYTDAQMQQFADLNDQVAKNARDFEQSMADIKVSHEKNIASITESIDDETASFDKANAKRTENNQKTLDNQADAHEKKVKTIQDQIDKETAKGWLANQQTLADLNQRLADENDSYTQSVADTNAKYQEDTQNAKDAHDQKVKDLQDKLAEENAFMLKHNDDLKNIRNSDALDEIDKLKQTHADEMAQFDKQRKKIADSGTAAGTDYITNQATALKAEADAQNATFAGVGTTMGNDMATALKNAFLNSIKELPGKIADFFYGSNPITTTVTGPLAPGQQRTTTTQKDEGIVQKVFDWLSGWLDDSASNPPPKFSSGVTNFQGGLAYVHQGEMLVNLPKGTDVLPAGQSNGKTANGGNTFNITNNFSRDSDPTAFMRELSFNIGRS